MKSWRCTVINSVEFPRCPRELLRVLMRSLHDVRDMDAYRADHVCLSIRMIQLKNHWTDLDEIWYGRYTIGD
jgi:hypothetical protein